MARYEVEQKFRLKNPSAFRKRLKQLGAKRLSGGFEKNELWDLDGRLKSMCAVLRLRETPQKDTLTFKGPRLKSRYKKRAETETPVDAVKTRLLLKQLGYRVSARYEKKRDEYLLKKAHVTMDYLKGFGWFAEIEAPERRIEMLARLLGFSNQDREERSYLEMVYGNRSRWAGK